jgi:hypothetical protein
METLRDIVLQESNEARFSRKHIDGYIRDFIKSDAVAQAKVKHGVELITAYMEKTYYASKNKRISQLSGMDLEILVIDLLVGISYCLHEELFTSITAKLASRLRFDDKAEAITTVAELVAVLCNTDAFDINKAHKMASMMVVSQLNLPDELIKFIEESQYLPPMVCEPLELDSNYSSGYLSHKDSLILRNNHHDGDICLDVLNIVNSVALKLDTTFLSTVEEEPTTPLESTEQLSAWTQFKKQSYGFYMLLASQGNRFYLTHKVDKRGRIYASGYHISTQGTSFKKASIELANEEIVTGV